MVYFIHDETGHTIKIGCAWNPHQRLSTLQISTSNKLVLLGYIGGMKQVEHEVRSLATNYFQQNVCDPMKQVPHIRGEWYDDRIMPFVLEIIKSPQSFLKVEPKKTPARTRQSDRENSIHSGNLVLEFDSGESFRETFILKAVSPEHALAALSTIARARIAFLVHAARIVRIVVPGCSSKIVDLRGTFVDPNCNPREGLRAIFHSGHGQMTMDGVKHYVQRWFHGVPTELHENVFDRKCLLTPLGQQVLKQFGTTLNRQGCVFVTKSGIMDVVGIQPHFIATLPRGELRSEANRKAESKRRSRRPQGLTSPKHGIVYFIQDTVTLAIKVGFCMKQPSKRLSALQIGNAHLLQLLGHITS